MSINHDLEKILAKGLEKGLVKGVEKLIDNGSINEIAQILICTAEQQILKIIEITAIAAIASNSNGNSLLSGLEKSMEQALTASAKTTLLQIQDILINLLKNKYGTLENTPLENEIKSTTDINKLNNMIQSVVEYDNIESFASNISDI